MPPLPKKTVDRLGERLRVSETITPEDLELLDRFRSEHLAAMERVVREICDLLPDMPAPAARLKTVTTIVDKLRRERGMKLSRMHDVAGVRLVIPGGRHAQDLTVTALERLFAGRCRVIDRRKLPSYGYRAVHVIPELEGKRVEVQVRTERQNRWAQIVERLADKWGRGIRYGGDPAEPDAMVQPGVTRREVWQQLKEISDVIDEAEREEARLIVSAGQDLTTADTDAYLMADLRAADDLLASLGGLAL